MKRSLGILSIGVFAMLSPSCAKQDGLVTLQLAMPRGNNSHANALAQQPHGSGGGSTGMAASPSPSPSPPVSVDAMDCYAVNINAPDIPDVNAGQDNNSPPGCPYQGITSTLATNLQSTVSLKVPPGGARDIMMIGAKTDGPNGCGSATTVSELDALFPKTTAYRADGSSYQVPHYRLYVLGETTTDLYRDTTVTIQSTYTQSTPYGPGGKYEQCFNNNDDNGDDDGSGGGTGPVVTPSPSPSLNLPLLTGYSGSIYNPTTNTVITPPPVPSPLSSTSAEFYAASNFGVTVGPSLMSQSSLTAISTMGNTTLVPFAAASYSQISNLPLTRADLIYTLPTNYSQYSSFIINATADGQGSSPTYCGQKGVSLFVWSQISSSWVYLNTNAADFTVGLTAINGLKNESLTDFASSYPAPDGTNLPGPYLIFSFLRNGVCEYNSSSYSNSIGLGAVSVEIYTQSQSAP